MVEIFQTNEPLLKGNGVSVYGIRHPDEVQEGDVFRIEFFLARNELVLLPGNPNVCDDIFGPSLFGHRVDIRPHVAGTQMTSKEVCVDRGGATEGWRYWIDVPVPDRLEPFLTYPVAVEFWKGSEEALMFDSDQPISSYDGMPNSTLITEISVTQADQPPDDGNGDGGNGDGGDGGNGDGSDPGDGDGGQRDPRKLAFLGLLGAGAYFTYKKGEGED